jgi:hypothetical protein
MDANFERSESLRALASYFKLWSPLDMTLRFNQPATLKGHSLAEIEDADIESDHPLDSEEDSEEEDEEFPDEDAE